MVLSWVAGSTARAAFVHAQNITTAGNVAQRTNKYCLIAFMTGGSDLFAAAGAA